MHLFLSHRRLDGEDLTAAFTRLRTSTTQRTFRDLFDVKVGDDAQDVIETRLRDSDAVIFLDTPKTGESPWIAKELRVALQFGLLIVWVKVGPDTNRVPLQVLPAGSAHFVLPDIDPRTEEIPRALVEEIVHKAAQIHHRDYVDRLFSEFLRLQDIVAQHGITLTQIDPRKMVYSLSLQRPRDRYLGGTVTISSIRYPGCIDPRQFEVREFTLLPGKYVIKFLARDNETGRIGTYQTPFVIPNLSKHTTTVPTSSVVLGSQRTSGKYALLTSKKGSGDFANPLVNGAPACLKGT